MHGVLKEVYTSIPLGLMVHTFSMGQHTSTYGWRDAMCSSWCTIVALVSMISKSLAKWTGMEHDEARTFSFSRSCDNHCWIATAGTRHLGKSIAGWHSAPSWPFACENTRLHCRQRQGTLCIDVTVRADHRCGLRVTSLLLTQKAPVRSPVGSIFWLDISGFFHQP